MNRPVIRALFAVILSISSSYASNISFSGAFLTGADQQSFFFSTTGGTTTSIRTLSYGGGTSIQGNPVSAGGFDPLLTVFQADGTQVGSFDNSASAVDCLAGITAGPDGCLDAYFNNSLSEGSYFLVLSQWNNTSNGDLVDGFTYDNSCIGEFCSGFSSAPALTGNWEVDFISVTSASQISSAPEPGTLALTGLGATAFALFRRRSAAKL